MSFTISTFLMSLAGLSLHFLFSWGEYYRSTNTPRIGPVPYLTLDLPSWIAAPIGTAAFYFAAPEVASWMGVGATTMTPGVALLIGYTGSSMAQKLLGTFSARASVR